MEEEKRGTETCSTFTVLSTAPEKRRPLETASAVTLPWCLSRVCVQIMLSMLHTYNTHTHTVYMKVFSTQTQLFAKTINLLFL